jgi:PAS domain S-box-containing protein
VANFRDAHSSTERPATPLDPGNAGRESPRAALYHAVFEHAPDAQLLADDYRRYLDGNRAARTFLGVSKQTLLDSRIDDFTPPSMRAGLDKIWEEFLARGSMEGVFPIRLANGLERSILYRAKANVRPGRHLSSFVIAPGARQPTQLQIKATDGNSQLTFREREVLTLLARGSSGEEIAEQLSLSYETVRTHLRNSIQKLGARSRAHATAVALRSRQIDP